MRRVTFNLGARFDHLTGGWPTYDVPAGLTKETFNPMKVILPARLTTDNTVPCLKTPVKYVGVFASNGPAPGAAQVDASFDFFEFKTSRLDDKIAHLGMFGPERQLVEWFIFLSGLAAFGVILMLFVILRRARPVAQVTAALVAGVALTLSSEILADRAGMTGLFAREKFERVK